MILGNEIMKKLCHSLIISQRIIDYIDFLNDFRKITPEKNVPCRVYFAGHVNLVLGTK